MKTKSLNIFQRIICTILVIFCTFSAVSPETVMASGVLPKMNSVEYSINGDVVRCSRNGELSVGVKVGNNGFSGDVISVVAIYDGEKLEDIKIKKHTFIPTESIWQTRVKDMYLTHDKTVKTFLWEKTSLTPLSKAYVLPESDEEIQIFSNAGFENNTNVVAIFNGKGNTLQKGTDENGEACCVFKRDTQSDFHLDMHIFPYDAKKIIYQYDLKIISPNLTFYSNLITQSGMSSKLHSLNLGKLTLGDTSIPLNLGKWYTISSVYDTEEKTSTLYLDYEKVADKVNVGDGFSQSNAKLWRLHVPISDSASDFFVDNISIYSSASPKDMKGYGYAFYNKIPIMNYDETNIYERPDQYDIRFDYSKSDIKGKHPRIMLTDEDFENVRNRIESDEFTKFFWNYLKPPIDSIMEKQSPLIYELRDGVRLLDVSYEMMDNMMLLGLAWQITGDEKYVERAWIDLESVANFPDWHPDHALDVGAMAVGYAVGYDWMYDGLSPQRRKIIEDGALKNGFNIYVEAYQGRHQGMTVSTIEEGNHNMVMNSGATFLGLAFFDTFPELSAYLISSAANCLEPGIKKFTPDGEWFEGMGYTGMTVEFLTYQLSALEKAFGTVYGLDKTPGIDKINEYYLYMQSPQGSFAYSDGASQNVHFDAGLIWLAQHFNDYDELSTYNNLYGFYPDIRVILWADVSKISGEANLELDKYYEGQQVLTMRDSWIKSEQTTFAGIKGRSPDLGHGHLDAGSFAFYSDGVRWTHEYGKEDYNLPGYWYGDSISSPRWQYFRLRAEGHNCLIINPDQYGEFDPMATAPIGDIHTSENGVMGIIDMTDCYMEKAQFAKRGAMLTDMRKSLVVRDELILDSRSDIYWFMHTAHQASVTDDGKSVTIVSNSDPSKILKIDIECSHPYEIEIKPAMPLSTSPNPTGMADDTNINRIELKTTASGEFSVTAKLTPSSVKNMTNVREYHIPLANWDIAP